ncbi:MAG: PBSX family phage terminase large subunit [Selenomonadales bacterium]|nr:PBSX family phage terminase large subunit [Selenomonadales bacterium]
MQSNIYLPDVIGGGYGAFWRSRHRYRAVKGSRGSKKSKTTALYYIYKMMQYPAANLLVVRRNFRTLKDSCYSDLLWAAERLGVSNLWKGTTSPLELTYLPTGQKILFRGLDNGLKITSISVPKGVLCWVWIEEAYEVTNEADFDKLDMSIRGQMPSGLWKQITLTFNPWSANSWLKKRFFDVESRLIFTATTTYECNEWLDEADALLFEEMKRDSPRRYRIEGMGDWGISEGLIYEKVRYETFDTDAVRALPNIISAFGLDFGFTDPTVLICMLIDNKNKIIYVFDEWYKRGVTNAQIAERIKAMGYGGQRIVCDCAEPKSIAELQEYGIRGAEPSRKGKDSVLHGIQLMQNYTFVVHTRCREFFKEISNYCWATDRFGKPIDKPEHEFSHGPDAARYGAGKVLTADRFSFE